MIYTHGVSIAGLKEINDDAKLNSEDIVVCIYGLKERGADSGGMVCRVIRHAIEVNATPILVLAGASDGWFRIAANQMVLACKYGIYETTEEMAKSQSYVVSLTGRKVSREEVRKYLSIELADYNAIESVLEKASAAYNTGNMAGLVEALTNSGIGIDEIITCLQGLKGREMLLGEATLGAEKSSEEISKLEEEKKALEEEKRKLEEELEGARGRENGDSEASNKQVESLESRIKMMEAEIERLQKENSTLENKINNSGPVIKTYTEIRTSVINCKARAVLYFKEVSQVRYGLTLISQLKDYMQKARRLKVKLIIYDNEHGFMGVYRPLRIIDTKEFVNNRLDVTDRLEQMVVTEPNPAIIEGILKSDCDVVMVLDRLHMLQDIVSGNNVFKYWLINSNKDMLAVSSSLQISPEHVITSYDEITGALDIASVDDYKGKTTSARMQEYFTMKTSAGKLLINEVMKRANIDKIAGRTVRVG